MWGVEPSKSVDFEKEELNECSVPLTCKRWYTDLDACPMGMGMEGRGLGGEGRGGQGRGEEGRLGEGSKRAGVGRNSIAALVDVRRAMRTRRNH